MIFYRVMLCIARSVPSQDICLSVCHTPEVVYNLSNGAIYNDLERLLTQISRSRYYLMLNISQTDEIQTYSYLRTL